MIHNEQDLVLRVREVFPLEAMVELSANRSVRPKSQWHTFKFITHHFSLSEDDV